METITTNSDPAPIDLKYYEEFDYAGNEVVFKPTASNYALKAHFLQKAIYNHIKGDKQIINFMIEEFKKCNIYNLKNELEKKEIIKFLKDNSNIEEILADDDEDEDSDDSNNNNSSKYVFIDRL